MAIPRIFLILALMALMTTTGALASTGDGEENFSIGGDHELEVTSDPSGAMSRFLGSQYNPRATTMTCDKFPRVCRADGSPGPDCCKKRCVNVMTDGLNCGACGMRCGYGSTCCAGRCVNVMFDRKNCGSCKNRCKKGSFCKYGMCSYA